MKQLTLNFWLAGRMRRLLIWSLWLMAAFTFGCASGYVIGSHAVFGNPIKDWIK